MRDYSDMVTNVKNSNEKADVDLFEFMQTAVLVTDENLCIVQVNNATEVLLLNSRSHLIGLHMSSFFHEAIDLPVLCQRALHKNQCFSLVNTDLLVDSLHCLSQTDSLLYDKNRVVDVSVTPLVSKPIHKKHAKNVVAQKNMHDPAQTFLFEIKAQGQHEEILHQEQQLQQQKITRQLIRNVAHEIKNPLASIRGAAQLIQMTATPLDLPQEIHEELNEYTNVMIKESDRLKALADSMLGSNTLLEKEQVNIHELLEHVRTLVKSQFPVLQVQRDYDISLPNSSIDKNSMIQVFLNISLNAAQALQEMKDSLTDAPMCITFKTRIAYHKLIGNDVYKQAIQVSIIDNGNGIPETVQKTLFYPMVSARVGGTGLGLSIAQEIVRHHDGEISYQSQQGNTVFNIFLPFT